MLVSAKLTYWRDRDGFARTLRESFYRLPNGQVFYQGHASPRPDRQDDGRIPLGDIAGDRWLIRLNNPRGRSCEVLTDRLEAIMPGDAGVERLELSSPVLLTRAQLVGVFSTEAKLKQTVVGFVAYHGWISTEEPEG